MVLGWPRGRGVPRNTEDPQRIAQDGELYNRQGKWGER
jgi:hypothetical protein